jgi:hypothetical protein
MSMNISLSTVSQFIEHLQQRSQFVIVCPIKRAGTANNLLLPILLFVHILFMVPDPVYLVPDPFNPGAYTKNGNSDLSTVPVC